MAVSNLHEAALVLQGAREAIAKLLAETAPMQRTHLARIPYPLPDDELEALEEETGYGPFWTAAERLRELLGSVDDLEKEVMSERHDAA